MKGHPMKYTIEETIVREYLIDAENLDHALSLAHNVINESTEYQDFSQGISFITELETGKEIKI
jgi:hypothetical protein